MRQGGGARLSTLTLSRRLCQDAPDHKLQTLATWLCLDRGTAHRAEGDVRTTLALWRQLQRRSAERTPAPQTLDQWSKL